MSIPSILAIIQIASLFFYYKHDSPPYYYQLSMTKELKEAISYIYSDEADEKAVFQFLTAGERYDPNVSLYQKYKWAFWAGLSLAAIQQLSGMIIVSFYAPQVFAKQGDSQAQILSLVVALINFAATFVAIYISDSIF